jgi:hypothetical protein
MQLCSIRTNEPKDSSENGDVYGMKGLERVSRTVVECNRRRIGNSIYKEDSERMKYGEGWKEWKKAR